MFARHTEAAIPLWYMVGWQAEALEINNGEKSCLQPMQDPTLEQVTSPKEVCDSEGSPWWSGL